MKKLSLEERRALRKMSGIASQKGRRPGKAPKITYIKKSNSSGYAMKVYDPRIPGKTSDKTTHITTVSAKTGNKKLEDKVLESYKSFRP